MVLRENGRLREKEECKLFLEKTSEVILNFIALYAKYALALWIT